jgi:hypothetical protein
LLSYQKLMHPSNSYDKPKGLTFGAEMVEKEQLWVVLAVVEMSFDRIVEAEQGGQQQVERHSDWLLQQRTVAQVELGNTVVMVPGAGL